MWNNAEGDKNVISARAAHGKHVYRGYAVIMGISLRALEPESARAKLAAAKLRKNRHHLARLGIIQANPRLSLFIPPDIADTDTRAYVVLLLRALIGSCSIRSFTYPTAHLR